MDRSIALFSFCSFAIAIGFLVHTHQSIHNDFLIAKAEAVDINKTLEAQEELKLIEIEHLSKRSTKYTHLSSDYEIRKQNTQLILNAPKAYQKMMFDLDTYHFNGLAKPFIQSAFASDDSYLAQYYLQMALNSQLQEIMNHINPHKTYNFTTKIEVDNEPVSYHLNEEYPLHFITINTLKDNQIDHFKMSLDNYEVFLNDFPFIFEEPQSQKHLYIRSSNVIDPISGLYSTKNHELLSYSPSKSKNDEIN